jgi:hypothetical protein
MTITVILSLLPSRTAASGKLQSVTLSADFSARTRMGLWHSASWLRASCPANLPQFSPIFTKLVTCISSLKSSPLSRLQFLDIHNNKVEDARNSEVEAILAKFHVGS